jgi:hypothetical protein
MLAQAIWPSVLAVGRHFLTANECSLSNSVGFVADELAVGGDFHTHFTTHLGGPINRKKGKPLRWLMVPTM